MTQTLNTEVTRYDLAAWIATAAVLLLILLLHLLPTLLAGLTVYQLVHLLVPLIRSRAMGSGRAKLMAVTLIAAAVITLLSLTIISAVGYLRHGSDSLPALLQKLVEIIEGARSLLPYWLDQLVPEDTQALQAALVGWLREHTTMLRGAGAEAGRVMVHILFGMIVGALLSLHEAMPIASRRPLAGAIAQHAARFSEAFRRVVFAQAWIAAVNSVLTWLYLGVALPLLGVDLPLVKTMVAVTFIAGLVPILGNLLSNTVIVLVSLSHSLQMALTSLIFLVTIHKLEYFLNARIIGSHIHARAWELLIAMLLMEAAFGIAGLIAAPIYYAHIKSELSDKGLV